MPRLRNAEDQVIDVDEQDVGFYASRGWTPETAETQYEGLQRSAATPGDTGIIGAIDAGVTSFASGATLGLTDVIGSSISTDNERATALRNRQDNAIISGVGNFAGSLVPAFANPGTLLARTPAGVLGTAANEAAAAGRAIGGARGAVQSIGAGAVEGAIGNAGSYLGEVALADKDVSAEGLSAALGNGFKFGGAFSAGALGIEKGTIAARKLFSKPAEAADDAAAAAAASSDWERKSQETLTANEQAASAARVQLDEARAAREAADVARKQATASIAEQRAALAREAPAEQVGIPTFTELETHGSAGSKIYGQREFRSQVVDPREVVERGWAEHVSIEPSADEIAAARAAIGKGRRLLVEFDVRRGDQLAIRDATSSANLAASIEAGVPIQGSFRGISSDLVMVNSKGAPVHVMRGGAVDAEAAALDAVKKKIIAGEVAGEIGPFTDEGLEAAAQRTLKRQASRADDLEAVVSEYDEAKRALDEMKARIERREIEGEIGPFTPQGLELAAQRELGRRATEAAAPPPAAIADVAVETAPVAAPSRPGRVRVRPAPAQSGKTLEELLAETSAKLGEGATLADLNKAAAAPTMASLADELDEAARIMTRYEKAAAAVTEAVGDSAPEGAKAAAKAVREAESVADRKLTESMTHALDDSVEMGPAPPSARERLERAKASRAEADIAYAQARTAETQAAIGDRQAREALRKTKAEIKASAPKTPELDTDPLGGFPDPSVIPVVGPLLRSFLAYRVMKAGAKAGRVAATPRNKVAALAAKAKNAVFDAVDKSLGIVQKGAEKAPKAIRPFTATGIILGERAFDDGEPDAEEKATIPQKTSVRMREVAYAATNPQAVAQRVRRELRGVHDPDVVNATIAHQQSMYSYLNDKAPKRPPDNPFAKREWEPPMALAMQWGRRLEVANNPLAAFEALEQQCLTPEAAETLRAVYPKLFAQAQSRLMARAADIKHPLPYRQMIQNSLLFDVPLGPSMEPENMAILATAHASGPDVGPPLSLTPPAPATPPTPSIAGGVDLTSLYQTASDRRAMR